jgi:hypothetical protein
MGFRLKSGNRTSFKNMGGTEKSPAKHFVDDVPDHNDGHSDDLQTPEEHEAAKSPEMTDEQMTKKKVEFPWGEDSRDWPKVKSPGKAKKLFGEATTEGATESAESMVGIVGPKAKKESPAKQTDTHFADGTKKSKRQIEEQKIHPDEYWYKINNKPATKAQYIKYKNKPGGDEPGKQTNDPTVSLAKKSADKRTKINK